MFQRSVNVRVSTAALVPRPIDANVPRDGRANSAIKVMGSSGIKLQVLFVFTTLQPVAMSYLLTGLAITWPPE